MLNVDVSEDAVAITLKYWTLSLSSGHALNVARTFSHAVSTILEHLNNSLDEINLSSPDSCSQINRWNDKLITPLETCIHTLVKLRALEAPDSPAIEAWDGKFSFQALNATATKLSHFLRELDIGPEVIVAFCFSKSAWTVVACLAILKAGGACVALVPSYPSDGCSISCAKQKLMLPSAP